MFYAFACMLVMPPLGQRLYPVLTEFIRFRHFCGWFVWSLISITHTWQLLVAFSLTLNTTAFDYGTLEWFKTSICMSVLVDFHHQIHNTHTIIRSTAHYLDYIKRNTAIYFFVSYSYLSIESTEFIPFAYYESEGRKSGHKISLKPWAWD